MDRLSARNLPAFAETDDLMLELTSVTIFFLQ